MGVVKRAMKITSLDPIVHCSVEHIYPSSTHSSPQRVATLKMSTEKGMEPLDFLPTNVVFIYLSIYLSIYPSIHLSIYLSIYLSIFLFYSFYSILFYSILSYPILSYPILSIYLSIYLYICKNVIHAT